MHHKQFSQPLEDSRPNRQPDSYSGAFCGSLKTCLVHQRPLVVYQIVVSSALCTWYKCTFPLPHTCTCTCSHIIQDSTLRLLREESHVLSKSKAGVEQYLRSVKSHLQTLDSMRRALRTKISTLSQSLHLDAQSFKVREMTLVSHAVL